MKLSKKGQILSPILSQTTLRLFNSLLGVHHLFLYVKVTIIIKFKELWHLIIFVLAQTFLDFSSWPSLLPSHTHSILVPPPATVSIGMTKPLPTTHHPDKTTPGHSLTNSQHLQA